MVVKLVFKIEDMEFPLDRFYYIKDGAHIWLKLEKNEIKLGLDSFAAQLAGQIEYIIINKGKVKSNDLIGSFESNKYVNKLYSPISGEINSINKEIIDNPKQINKNPYCSWICSIKPDSKLVQGKHIIKGKQKISKWISQEIIRTKSFK
jgi:glycine cleavage system H protein